MNCDREISRQAPTCFCGEPIGAQDIKGAVVEVRERTSELRQ